jgi:hypothetical protein
MTVINGAAFPPPRLFTKASSVGLHRHGTTSDQIASLCVCALA